MFIPVIFIVTVNKDGNLKTASRCARVLELAEDGSLRAVMVRSCHRYEQ